MITQMDTNTNSLHKVVSLIILILIISAGGGLSIVWLRQQISVTATSSQALEHELLILDRKIRSLDAKIGELHNPNNLLRHATDLGLKISLPYEDQIVRLSRDDNNIITTNVSAENFKIPGNLASLNP